MPSLAFLSQIALPSATPSRETFDALRMLTADRQLDRFGWAYTAHDGFFSFVPWEAGSTPDGNPLLFIDESYDESTRTTLYAGLLMSPVAAFILAGWYLGNLVTLRRQIAGVWPRDSAPPRLHFREMFNNHARQKTTWRELPDRGTNDLISAVADALGENEQVHPFVVRIPDAELDKALAGAFPGGVDKSAVDDLIGLIVANALRTAIVDNTRRGIEIELVIDFDATKISVGRIREEENALEIGGRRQATLRFMEALASVPTDPHLLVEPADRHTSNFPAGFTWTALATHGYAFRPLIEAVGLQFADLYVNVWRHLQDGAYPQLRVSRRILNRAKQTDYFWAPEARNGTHAPTSQL